MCETTSNKKSRETAINTRLSEKLRLKHKMGKDGYFIMIEGIVLEEYMSMNLYFFKNRASRYILQKLL